MKHVLRDQRVGWLQVARGEVAFNGLNLGAGDGAAVEKETELFIQARAAAEVLLFDTTL